MVKLKIASDKKGVSSIFLAVLIVIIILILTMSLFASIGISAESSLVVLKKEQLKQQEAILLSPGCVQRSGDIIQKITVNNTGSIPVKISAIYINSLFVTDPQLLMKPQATADINVANLGLSYNQNIFKTLTITTDRGTKYSAVIKDLESGEISSLDTIYGPIRLIFEDFKWAPFQDQFSSNYLNTATWSDGWKVNPSSCVIWRMRIQNVDIKTIDLGSKCCFVLRGPFSGQSLPVFYVDTPTSDLQIKPREYASLYFVWKQPDETTRNQNSASSLPSGSTATISFLVLEGSIGGKPLGETIPFEAVYIGS